MGREYIYSNLFSCHWLLSSDILFCDTSVFLTGDWSECLVLLPFLVDLLSLCHSYFCDQVDKSMNESFLPETEYFCDQILTGMGPPH